MTSSSVDEYLQMLANVHRRRVLEYLRRGQRQRASIDELVEHLRTLQGGPASTGTRDGERIRIGLIQMYLPQLSTHGLVDWDSDRGEVRYRPNEVVEAVLDVLAEDSVPVEMRAGAGTDRRR